MNFSCQMRCTMQTCYKKKPPDTKNKRYSSSSSSAIMVLITFSVIIQRRVGTDLELFHILLKLTDRWWRVGRVVDTFGPG